MTTPQQIEKLELLDGSRAGNREKAAVRIEDVKDLLQLAKIKTQSITAAPTMDDFNSMLRDLEEISNRLATVAAAVQRKVLR
ncbi:hypothetical protein [Agrobacterium sp. lyk4-40-TYG-31]|uniref:hypothetical protein n=1 Tax=Agrobacterium sp. lyk4-40-TYG-31 TaxID=3040276 RepID=UPI00254CA27D|nr:hypothetical protein [Agrobacterium sp. lyk4-40-TYG-31]